LIYNQTNKKMDNNKSFQITATEDTLIEAFSYAFRGGKDYETDYKDCDFKMYRKIVIEAARKILIERHFEIINNK